MKSGRRVEKHGEGNLFIPISNSLPFGWLLQKRHPVSFELIAVSDCNNENLRIRLSSRFPAVKQYFLASLAWFSSKATSLTSRPLFVKQLSARAIARMEAGALDRIGAHASTVSQAHSVKEVSGALIWYYIICATYELWDLHHLALELGASEPFRDLTDSGMGLQFGMYSASTKP